MPFIQLESLNIHYEQQDKGAIPIILLHGNFGSWHYWQPVLQNTPSGYCAYAPDFRGCGDSQVTDDGYNVETLCQDIIQFADQLKLDKFHLVGHSLGGAVAQQLAGTMPDRIITLTLVAPAPACGLKRLQRLPKANTFFSAENMFQFLEKINIKRHIMSASIKKSMPGLSEHLLIQAVDDALKMDIRAFNGYLETLKIWTGLNLLKSFNFPVLIVYGELDNVISLADLQDMQKEISDCRLHIMQNIGHSPQLENPKAFNKLLSAFLCGNKIELTSEQIIRTKQLSLVAKAKLLLQRLLRNNS